MKQRGRFLSILLRVLTAVLSIVLIALAGFLLVLAQPKQDQEEKPKPQPLLTASPALNISSEADFAGLVESFPVPVLSFMSGSGMVFVSGTSADAGLQAGDLITAVDGNPVEDAPALMDAVAAAGEEAFAAPLREAP